MHGIPKPCRRCRTPSLRTRPHCRLAFPSPETRAAFQAPLFHECRAACHGEVLRHAASAHGPRSHSRRSRPCGTTPVGRARHIWSLRQPCQRGSRRNRKSVVKGTSVSVRVDLGGRRIIKTNNVTHSSTPDNIIYH